MYSQRSIQLMASTIEQVMVKNNHRFLHWKRKPTTNANINNNISIQPSQRPRHFASKTNPLNKEVNATNNTAHHLFPSITTQERDAKFLFGLVPTLLALGCITTVLDRDYWWSTLNNVLPLATILTGFGMLGRENYRLEEKIVESEIGSDEHDQVPRLLHQSSASSLSTTESTIDYSNQTIAMEGIEIPKGCTVDGRYLERHGSGLRSFAFFRGIAVRVYVATLYSSKPFVEGKEIVDVNSLNQPLQMDFTFLRGFTAGQCKLAWQKQLDESVSHRYDGLENDKQEFLAKIATIAMKANGTVTVQILDDKTLIFDQGTYTGEIIGKDFQRAFLSMWFGDKPVTTELKARLLGQE